MYQVRQYCRRIQSPRTGIQRKQAIQSRSLCTAGKSGGVNIVTFPNLLGHLFINCPLLDYCPPESKAKQKRKQSKGRMSLLIVVERSTHGHMLSYNTCSRRYVSTVHQPHSLFIHRHQQTTKSNNQINKQNQWRM
jgi:hypothetical protein